MSEKRQINSLLEEGIRRFDQNRVETGVSISRYFRIAGRTLELRFSDSHLAKLLTRSIAHLEITDRSYSDLVIYILNHIGQLLDHEDSLFANYNDFKKERGEDLANPLYLISPGRTRALYESGAKALSILDLDRKLGLFGLEDLSHVPFYLAACPMRNLLQWWLSETGLLMLHGGALGLPSGGALIGGRSGSGKSTCALIGVLDGRLKYLGDDFVILENGPKPELFSVYNSVKLDAGNMVRFPAVEKFLSNKDKMPKEKGVIYLYEGYADRLIPRLPINLILLPRIMGSKKSRVVPASRAECLKAVSLSSMFQFYYARRLVFHELANLVKQVPGYVLELGKDMSAVPDMILGLI